MYETSLPSERFYDWTHRELGKNSELQMGIDSATLRDLVGVKQTQLSP